MIINNNDDNNSNKKKKKKNDNNQKKKNSDDDNNSNNNNIYIYIYVYIYSYIIWYTTDIILDNWCCQLKPRQYISLFSFIPQVEHLKPGSRPYIFGCRVWLKPVPARQNYQWSYHVSVIYIYIQLCVCVYVYVCVYIQLFYTSVIPSGYGMVQCDNQWFGIPPINGHPAFQCESVTPLQQPSLMLACLVTSHSRKSASAGKRIPCSPSSRHWGGVWLAIPIQYSDSFQRETYRPIYIYIHSSAQLLLILICGWATQQKKWESLGMTVPFSRNQESLRTCFTHKKTTLKPWALSPMPMIGTCKRTENTLW